MLHRSSDLSAQKRGHTTLAAGGAQRYYKLAVIIPRVQPFPKPHFVPNSAR